MPRQVITSALNYDGSSFPHEFAGHVFRKQLRGGDLATLEKWAAVENGEWTVNTEEKFANSYERYLRDGIAPNDSLKGTFARFKDWLRAI